MVKKSRKHSGQYEDFLRPIVDYLDRRTLPAKVSYYGFLHRSNETPIAQYIHAFFLVSQSFYRQLRVYLESKNQHGFFVQLLLQYMPRHFLGNRIFVLLKVLEQHCKHVALWEQQARADKLNELC
jgi:hypothetical protein